MAALKIVGGNVSRPALCAKSSAVASNLNRSNSGIGGDPTLNHKTAEREDREELLFWCRLLSNVGVRFTRDTHFTNLRPAGELTAAGHSLLTG